MALRACGRVSAACHQAALVLLLALLVAQRAAAAAATGTLSVAEEGAVLRTLRQRLADTGLTPNGRHGWQPDDPRPHCSWRSVYCGSDGHVNIVDLEWDTVPPLSDKAQRRAAPLLLPELARFGSLRHLTFDLYYAPPVQAIPQQWGLPGAFPDLKLLEVMVPTLQGPLPDMHSGALPRLTSLHIEASNRTALFALQPAQQHSNTTATHGSHGTQDPAAGRRGRGLRSALPASWGAGPDVLPALEELTLVLQMVPPLPAGWARGFRRLRRLEIAAPVDAPMPAADGNVLPPEWAAGFPALRWLNLRRLGLTGSFPVAWEEGGFPLLTQLELARSALTGPLPERIFEGRPDLEVLSLEENRFTGTLPSVWGASQSIEGLSVRGNHLSGPLFPSAWLGPGSMPHLKCLSLDGNAALAGPLPATLPWPALSGLNVAGTQVASSTIPAGWCRSPNAAIFTIMDATNTTMRPELPPCAAKAMPSLTFYSGNQTMRTDRLGQAALHANRSTWAALLAVPLALLALAGMALLAVRRWRLCSPPAGRLLKRSSASEIRLLMDSQASEPSEGYKPSSPSGRRPHRIESMLRLQLAQSRIELVALRHLPAAMVHRVGAKQQGVPPMAAAPAPAPAAAAVAAAPPAIASVPYGRLGAVDEEQQHNSWGSFSSSGSGDSTEGLLRAGAPGPPASRQWGLGTDSLRLLPGELEMLSGPDGALCLLGEGGSSAVFLGRLGGQEDVAVKVVELCPGMDSRHVWHEVSLLRACVHRRLVALLGVACQGQLLMLVMELMRGGDLHSALQRPATRDALRWAARGRQVALDVAEALAFLHSCGVQHADLKPSNVLLTPDLRAKLTDLGVAQQLGSRSRQAVGGTTQYAAPEQLLGLPCTTKADVYSLGVLLTVLCTGRSLAARGQLRLPRVPDDCPQPVLELIQECICPDPARRPTAEEALRRLRDT